MDVVLVESDGECRVLKSSIPNILSTYPPGVYTTMYADACGQIEDKATHVRRLEMSIDAVNRHCNGTFGDIDSLFGLNVRYTMNVRFDHGSSVVKIFELSLAPLNCNCIFVGSLVD